MKAISLLLLAALSTPVFADLYQWKDENGRVHFSDTKPGSAGNTAPAVTTLKNPEPPRPSGAAANDAGRSSNSSTSVERQQRLLQVMKQDADQKERDRLSRQQEQQQKEEECEKYRSHQNSIAGRRIFRSGEESANGERIYLDEAERQEYDQQIAAAVAEKCK